MRIKSLTLFTPSLSEQKRFYADVLALPVTLSTSDSFKVQIGETMVEFRYDEQATPYHFAINIPSYQEKQAMDWLKPRVSILKDGEDEIVDFKSWNAQSMYFYDADHNILEFIARRNLDISSDIPFSPHSLLEVSEIGLATDDIKNKYDVLHQSCGLEIYDGQFEKFCAIGDEHGLFIGVNYELKNWFPTQGQASPSDFHAIIRQGDVSYAVDYMNQDLSVRALDS